MPCRGIVPLLPVSRCLAGGQAPSPAAAGLSRGERWVRGSERSKLSMLLDPPPAQSQRYLGTLSLSHSNSRSWLLSASQVSVRLSPSWTSGAVGFTRTSDTSGGIAKKCHPDRKSQFPLCPDGACIHPRASQFTSSSRGSLDSVTVVSRSRL